MLVLDLGFLSCVTLAKLLSFLSLTVFLIELLREWNVLICIKLLAPSLAQLILNKQHFLLIH